MWLSGQTPLGPVPGAKKEKKEKSRVHIWVDRPGRAHWAVSCGVGGQGATGPRLEWQDMWAPESASGPAGETNSSWDKPRLGAIMSSVDQACHVLNTPWCQVWCIILFHPLSTSGEARFPFPPWSWGNRFGEGERDSRTPGATQLASSASGSSTPRPCGSEQLSLGDGQSLRLGKRCSRWVFLDGTPWLSRTGVA